MLYKWYWCSYHCYFLNFGSYSHKNSKIACAIKVKWPFSLTTTPHTFVGMRKGSIVKMISMASLRGNGGAKGPSPLSWSHPIRWVSAHSILFIFHHFYKSPSQSFLIFLKKSGKKKISQKQVVEDIRDLWGDSKVLVLKCDIQFS